MDASKLTAEQMEWVCRYPLAQMLENAQMTKRRANKHDVRSIVYANLQIQQIAVIYKAVGYWQEKDGAEFTWERLSAEQEDRGN
jgi:hypothetical protein